jgi:choline kinase
VFGFEDITGLPWIEIDFADDVLRARSEILPRLVELPRAPQ